MLGRPSLQEGGTGNGRRVDQSLLSNCPETLVSPELVDLTFFGLQTNLQELPLKGQEPVTDAFLV